MDLARDGLLVFYVVDVSCGRGVSGNDEARYAMDALFLFSFGCVLG